MPLRVLYFIPSFGPGGAEKQLSILSSGLAKLGCEVHVAYHSGGPNMKALQASSVVLHHIKISNNYSPRLPLRVFALIAKIKPDIIQTWLPQMDIIAGIASYLLRTPYIVSERSSQHAYKDSFKTTLRLFVGRFSTSIIANSEAGADYWRSFIPSRSIHVIRNSISLAPALHSDFAPLNFPDRNSPIVLTIGRLSDDKNISFALSTAIELALHRKHVNFLFLGDGPLKDKLINKVKLYNLSDRIQFIPFSPYVSTYVAKASVFLSLSSFEGNPNAVIESAYLGLPLVISDIPAHRELFDDTSAYLVSLDSPKYAARVLSDALSNRSDAISRASKAKSRVSSFSADNMISNYLCFYNSVLNVGSS